MVTGGGQRRSGGRGQASWGQGLERAGAAGVGWSWRPSVEVAARVSACVSLSRLVSPVCWCHVHTGAQFLVHTCAASGFQVCPVVSCLCRLLCPSCLGGCWADHWLVGQLLAILVPVTSDPENACSLLGLTSYQPPVCGDVWLHEKDFLCPWWQVCVFACVFHHWPGYLCQSQHGCPGRVWMWVVCKWGERVSV